MKWIAAVALFEVPVAALGRETTPGSWIAAIFPVALAVAYAVRELTPGLRDYLAAMKGHKAAQREYDAALTGAVGELRAVMEEGFRDLRGDLAIVATTYKQVADALTWRRNTDDE